MAVLSTVFGYGAIGSRPAAGTVGYHYFASDEGILYRDSGSAWQAVSSLSGLVYAFSTTTTDSDPGVGTIRFDNGTPASVTTVYVDDLALNSDADLGTVWDNVTGARVLITQANAPGKYLLGEVTADTDGTGYWKLTVTVDASGTLPDNGALLSVHVLGGGGGGGGTPTLPWWHMPQAHVTQDIRLASGNIKSYSAGQTGVLQSGTLDIDGKTGAGGFTDTTRMCNCMYDDTPAQFGFRGLNGTSLGNVVPGIGQAPFYFMCDARFAVAADQEISAGLNVGFPGATPTSTAYRGIYFTKAPAQANWQAHVYDGTTHAETDTGVAWGTNTWYNFEIHVWDNGGTLTADFYIDGSLVATITDATSGFPTTDASTPLDVVIGSYWTSADVTTYDCVMFCSVIQMKVGGAANSGLYGVTVSP